MILLPKTTSPTWKKLEKYMRKEGRKEDRKKGRKEGKGVALCTSSPI
jgi:hypothetical protein